MPATHLVDSKLPAASGSSGRLVISPSQTDTTTAEAPGHVFADLSLDYTEAMHAFVAASQSASESASASELAEQSDKTSLKTAKRALRQEAATLREARRQTRQRRKQEDAAWRALRHAHRAERSHCAYASQWRAVRAQRKAQVHQRQPEDATWRHERQQHRDRWALLPLVPIWIAILVITDNCTRQCLGLPLFIAGPKVTSELIVTALRSLLPPELHFLISDRGVHFTAQAFQQLAFDAEFIHVLIARHRPQSNGIAERFVRTLKAWLADKTWTSDQQLAQLLAQFLAEYNERPHQGLALPGLSPNEFAKRIGLL